MVALILNGLLNFSNNLEVNFSHLNLNFFGIALLYGILKNKEIANVA